jgi:outer membrane immunogenic protein
VKKIALVLSVLALTTATAMAADLPARTYTKAPPLVDPVYNWTGFYIGGNAGYSWGRSNTGSSYFNTTTGAPIVPPAGSVLGNTFNIDGAIAGGQIGYNWQTSSFVWGLEADAQWSDERGRSNFSCAAVALVGGACAPGATFAPATFTGANTALDQRLEWFGTLRARAGLLATPKILLYATGGFAYGEIKTNGTLTGITPAGVAVATTGSQTRGRSGWTAGAGVEGVIAPNWTAKLEYLYMDLGSFDALSLSLAPASALGVNFRSSFTDHILRAGINYKFGG